MNLKCVTCIKEFIARRDEFFKSNPGWNNGDHEPRHLWDDVMDADTLVPVWEMKAIAGNVVMGCIALPVCMGHISATSVSAEEMAIRSGLVVPGGMG